MKNITFVSKYIGMFLLAGLFLVMGCKKEEALQKAPRLFRPVLSGDITGSGNWLEAKWAKVNGAVKYQVEISADSFKTVIKSVKLDTNDVVFDNLAWFTMHRIRVKAIAADTNENSRFSILGDKRTEKFPTIMQDPLSNEILDKAVIIRWTNSGAAVTNITLYLKTNGSIAKNVTLTSLDIANQYKIIDGLTPSTTYTVKLFSGSTLRGYLDFKTLPQIIIGSNIVDLTQNTNPDTLTAAYLSTLADGTLLVLKRGFTYNLTGGIALEKSITFISESNFGSPAVINIAGNFNFKASGTVGTVAFNMVDLIGNTAKNAYNSYYVFNVNVACNVTNINFNNCRIKNLRGVIRAQTSGATITNVSINNCLIDSIAGYGIVNCDNAGARIQNTTMTNSTVSDAQKLFVSKAALTSADVENCTFYYVPLGAGYFFDYNTFAVANGITIKNCIFGPGKPTTASPPVTSVNGFRPLTLNVVSTGNFQTSDLTFNVGYELPGLSVYSGTSANLFRSPGTDDFTIIDTRFAGKSTAGDPRWRLL